MRNRHILGGKLADGRRRGDLTQSELGKQVGVSSNQISRWERGEAIPSSKYLVRLFEVLDIEPSELYGLVIEAGAEEIEALREERDALHERLSEIVPLLERALVQLEKQAAAANGG